MNLKKGSLRLILLIMLGLLATTAVVVFALRRVPGRPFTIIGNDLTQTASPTPATANSDPNPVKGPRCVPNAQGQCIEPKE